MKLPPRIGTLLSRSLARLLRSDRLTHLSFQHTAHTYRLAASIEVLRNKYGWPIVGEERIAKTNDPVGRSARYFVYYLPISAIQQSGEDGREYAMKVFEWETRRIERRAATLPPKGKMAHQSDITRTHTTTLDRGGDNNGAD